MNLLAGNSIINISNIIAFILGIVGGFTLFLVLFLIIITKERRNDKKSKNPAIKDFNEEEIRNLILGKQNAFIYAVDEDEQDSLKTVLLMSKELVHEISSYYYPESEYPELELSINEASELIKYIVDSIMSLFNKKKALMKLKDIKISTIMSMLDKSKRIKNNKAVKAASEVNGGFKAFMNAINPIYWFRRIVVSGSLNLTIKKICKTAISIVGKESNKIYSKQLFNDESIDEQVIKDIKDLESGEE